MFEELVTRTTGRCGAAAVDAWTRVESAACARRVAAMVTMLDTAHAADGSAEREQWCLDNWGAVCAHIGAAQRLTSGAASGYLLVGTALRERLPKVQALFLAGVISYPVVKAIVARSILLTDPEAQHALDTALAEALITWGPMSVEKTDQSIDAFIEDIDPLAVRRTQTKARDRHLDVNVEDGSGLAQLFATLFAPDAIALNARADALADTVCPADPRTKDQRRSDALGALAHGAERLACLCDTPDCDAAHNPPCTGVVIHIVAHHDTITGPPTPDTPHEPHDPNGPDAPEDSPVSDDANDSGDAADRATSDGAGDPADPAEPADHSTSGDAASSDDRDEHAAPDSPAAAGSRGDSPAANGPAECSAPDETDSHDDPPVRADAADKAGPASDTGHFDDLPNANATATAGVDEAGPADGAEHAGPPDRAEAPNKPTTNHAAAECAGLDGHPPPMFVKPWRELTWADLTAPDPGQPATIRPAALMGGQFLPGSITRRTALGATLSVITHPGQAPPEPRYTPSRKLAEFIRCRDTTCRFPGCHQPATTADIDHTIPWPYGPTCASNLKCLCRRHHLLKTFWAGDPGWRDKQLPDGTIVWTAPDGHTHATTPGSRLLFPELCTPTAPVAPVDVPARAAHTTGLRMPRRKTTRTQDRARRVHEERELNKALIAAEAEQQAKAKVSAEQARAAAEAAEPPPPF